MESLLRWLPEDGSLRGCIFWGSVVVYVALQSYMLFRDCSFLARILAVFPLLLTVPYFLLTFLADGPTGPYTWGPTLVLSAGAALYLFAVWGFPRFVEWLVNRFM